VLQPEQYHARFGVAERSLSFTGLTVLREDCARHGVEVRIDGNRATVDIDGGPGISFENARVLVPG
jgi:hypothetical protein